MKVIKVFVLNTFILIFFNFITYEAKKYFNKGFENSLYDYEDRFPIRLRTQEHTDAECDNFYERSWNSENYCNV